MIDIYSVCCFEFFPNVVFSQRSVDVDSTSYYAFENMSLYFRACI